MSKSQVAYRTCNSVLTSFEINLEIVYIIGQKLMRKIHTINLVMSGILLVCLDVMYN